MTSITALRLHIISTWVTEAFITVGVAFILWLTLIAWTWPPGFAEITLGVIAAVVAKQGWELHASGRRLRKAIRELIKSIEELERWR